MHSRSMRSHHSVAGSWGVVALVLVCASLVAPAASGQNPSSMFGPSASGPNARLLFTQQDAVKAFDPVTGKGSQVGIVTGRINGTSAVE